MWCSLQSVQIACKKLAVRQGFLLESDWFCLELVLFGTFGNRLDIVTAHVLKLIDFITNTSVSHTVPWYISELHNEFSTLLHYNKIKNKTNARSTRGEVMFRPKKQ